MIFPCCEYALPCRVNVSLRASETAARLSSADGSSRKAWFPQCVQRKEGAGKLSQRLVGHVTMQGGNPGRAPLITNFLFWVRSVTHVLCRKCLSAAASVRYIDNPCPDLPYHVHAIDIHVYAGQHIYMMFCCVRWQWVCSQNSAS